LNFCARTHRFAVALVSRFGGANNTIRSRTMSVLALATPILMAAAGYSLLYLLLGGGLGGAILIFIVAKMLGR